MRSSSEPASPGLYMLHKLRELGLSARVYETADGVGGTWYWNRYPGARCDSESYYYSYSFSHDIEQEWEWTCRYPDQPEILKYLNYVADKLDLRRDIQFKTRVTEARYNEQTNRWDVETDDGNRVSAKFFISAVGCLSTAQMPDIKGLETFKGKWYHTGHWPHEGVDFTGQRVGIIGTGSTGIQAIPVIANEAAHLTVFQRTPNFTVPARNAPLREGFQREVKANYAEIRRKVRESIFGTPLAVADNRRSGLHPKSGSACTTLSGRSVALRFCCLVIMIWSSTRTPMIPPPNSFGRRFVKSSRIPSRRRSCRHGVIRLVPSVHRSTRRYYETFNRNNVTLVDIRTSPIEAITGKGIRTRDAEYELDAIVFATGFDAMTGSLFRLGIRGRGGIALEEQWADGPHTYLGIATSGFPNLFTITGPGSPSVLSNMPVSIEQHVEWIADCIQYLRSHDLDTIEATEDAQQAWVIQVNEIANATLFPQAELLVHGRECSRQATCLHALLRGCRNLPPALRRGRGKGLRRVRDGAQPSARCRSGLNLISGRRPIAPRRDDPLARALPP